MWWIRSLLQMERTPTVFSAAFNLVLTYILSGDNRTTNADLMTRLTSSVPHSGMSSPEQWNKVTSKSDCQLTLIWFPHRESARHQQIYTMISKFLTLKKLVCWKHPHGECQVVMFLKWPSCGSGVEPVSCYQKVTGLIALVCMSKCPCARYWTPNCSRHIV